MSYAKELEMRVLNPARTSTTEKVVSKMVFRTIVQQGPEYTWNRPTIGQEAIYRPYPTSEEKWFLRVYQDGTAYWRKQVYYFNYPTRNSIREMIEKYYSIVSEYEEEEGSYVTIKVMKRKPISNEQLRVWTSHSLDFADHLIKKFNTEEVGNAV